VASDYSINEENLSDEEFITNDQESDISIVNDSFHSVSFTSDFVNDSLYSEFSASDFPQYLQDIEVHQNTQVQSSHSSTPLSDAISWSLVTRSKKRITKNHVNASNTGTLVRKNNSVVYGAGKAAGVRSIQNYRPYSAGGQASNNCVTGVFVTRLHPATTTNQIKHLVKSQTARTCSPVRLKTRYGGYSSFYIPADQVMRAAIMDQHLWPYGTLIKPFRS
jgi:hypothetical protein